MIRIVAVAVAEARGPAAGFDGAASGAIGDVETANRSRGPIIMGVIAQYSGDG